MQINFPPARYWINRKTAMPIATSAFSGWIALFQMRLLIDDPDLWIIIIIGLGLGIFSWWFIAVDSWEAEVASVKADNTLNELKEFVRRSMPANEIPPRFRNLKRLTNEELREQVAAHVKSIRQFAKDTEEGAPQLPYWVRDPSLRTADEAERRRLWTQDTQDMIERHQRTQDRYLHDLRPDSIAILEELDRRVLQRRRAERASAAIELGVLAGVRPIQESADFLEGLARKLP